MRGAVVVASGLAAIMFVGVAITELSYIGSHLYRYGPAKVIAWWGVALRRGSPLGPLIEGQ
jgi:hypothetical protein